jgi:hypothetical protein
MLGKCSYCSTEFRYNPANKTGKYCSNTCQQNAILKLQHIRQKIWVRVELRGVKGPGRIIIDKPYKHCGDAAVL